MKILCYPRGLEKYKIKPIGASWIDLNMNQPTLDSLMRKHEVANPDKLLKKLWKDFKLQDERSDRIRIKIKKKV